MQIWNGKEFEIRGPINDNDFPFLFSLFGIMSYKEKVMKREPLGLQFPLVLPGLFTTNNIFGTTVAVAMATGLRLHPSAKRAKHKDGESV